MFHWRIIIIFCWPATLLFCLPVMMYCSHETLGVLLASYRDNLFSCYVYGITSWHAGFTPCLNVLCSVFRHDICLSVECNRISPQQSGTRGFPGSGPGSYAGPYCPGDGNKFSFKRSVNSGVRGTEDVSDFRSHGVDIPLDVRNCSVCSR